MTSQAKPLILYTAATPNGRRVFVFLEELKAAYGLEYDFEKLDLPKGVQRQPWFIKLNPNGKIPTLIDRARDNFVVFESAAILQYLAQHYDKEHKFSYDPVTQPNEFSEMIQWLFFAHGGVVPIQAQAMHFSKYAPEDIPYAKNRYVTETRRLFGVLEIRLTDRDWLVGAGRGSYTIADMNVLPFIRAHTVCGIESLDEWPNVKDWLGRYMEQSGVQSAALIIPW